MNHIARFEVGNFADGVHSVVGDCNGYTAQQRFDLETPIFSKAINSHIEKDHKVILDYGCGVGRIAREILRINKTVNIIGLDASKDERRLANEYVSSDRFKTIEPEELCESVDLIYCIYVIQHIPAIELRQAIERMHFYLKPGGKLIYCSSDHRLAVSYGNKFIDDGILGVFPRIEINRLFENKADLFNLSEQPKIIKDIVTADGLEKPKCIPHPAIVYQRRDIPDEIPYFNIKFPPLDFRGNK